jgi:hypothetical protein
VPTTAINALPYPSLTAPTPPDVPADLQALAEAIDGKLVAAFATATARDAAIPSPVDGATCYLADVDRYTGRINGAWEWVAAPTGTILTGTSGARPASPSSTVLYWNTTTVSLQVYSGGWAEAAPAALEVDAVKPTTTTRSSTSTLADDPHLTLALSTTGTYRITGMLIHQGNTAQYAKWAFAYSGTVTSGAVSASTGRDAGAALNGFYSSTVTTVNTTASANAADPLVAVIEATVVVSTTGTLSLQWAQSASNASACSVLAGSRISARKIA